jgi:NitT/TauT family transport system ATP-binding protein
MVGQDLVQVRDVKMVYGDRSGHLVEALSSVDLDVRRGEFVGLIGPSGCGKSSLLHIVGGMRRPTDGCIEVAGREVKAPMPDEISFVFQDYTLFPWRTVQANVEFALQLRGVSGRERREVARHYLELVGLSSFANSYPSQLSGGMQQRVAIARALTTEPELLLMDEPFGALDEQTRMVLGEELSRILESTGVTIIFVTHSLSEAVYLSDRVVVMSSRPGRIKTVLTVPEDRPRDSSFMTSDTFNKLRNELFDLLHEEVRSAALQEMGEVTAGGEG